MQKHSTSQCSLHLQEVSQPSSSDEPAAINDAAQFYWLKLSLFKEACLFMGAVIFCWFAVGALLPHITRAASGVVGSGTAASCTESALKTQLAVAPAGGTITFNCGANAVTINLTGEIIINADTTLDGGTADKITISGNRVTRVFNVVGTVNFNLKNITISLGRVTGSNGTTGSTGANGAQGASGGTGTNGGDIFGGAIFNTTAKISITNSTFYKNEVIAGTGGSGGTGGNSTTATNKGGIGGTGGVGGNAYGGAIYNINGSITLDNAIFIENRATGGVGGIGGKSGRAGGASVADGEGGNGGTGGNGFGGAIYSQNGSVTVISSTFRSVPFCCSGETGNAGIGGDGGAGGVPNGSSSIPVSGGYGGAGGTGCGGGLYTLAGTVTISKSLFAGNSGNGGNGGIKGASIGSAYNYNSIDSSGGFGCGGAIFSGANSVLSLNDSNFNSVSLSSFESSLSNSAKGGYSGYAPSITNDPTGSAGVSGGGSIFNEGTATINANKFVQSKSLCGGLGASFYGSYSGGGGAISNSGVITISNSLFSGNTNPCVVPFPDNTYKAIPLNGGAIVNYKKATIINSEFRSNSTQFGDIILTNAGGSGGAIYNGRFSETLIINSLFFDNSAENGGAIYLDGDLINGGNPSMNVTNSIFSGNNAKTDGGAIFSYGDGKLTNSFFYGNTAGGNGGGICSCNYQGNLSVTLDDTSNDKTTTNIFFSNTAGSGGAIANSGNADISNASFQDNKTTNGNGGGINNGVYSSARITVTRSLFVNNIASPSGGNGGGFANSFGGIAQVVNSTFSGNQGRNGGGVYSSSIVTLTNITFTGNTATARGDVIVNNNAQAGSFTVTNSIVSGTGILGNCSGTITDGGSNIDSASSCGFDAAKGSLLNTDPKLDSLKINGGPTRTHALLADSPAIDKGNALACSSVPVNSIDQRGFTRVTASGGANVGTACDIGAFEVAVFTPATPPTTINFQGAQVHQSPVLNNYSGLNFQPCVQFWDFTRADTQPLVAAPGKPGYKVSNAKAAAITSPSSALHCEFSVVGLNSPAAGGSRPKPGFAVVDELEFEAATPGNVTITAYDPDGNQLNKQTITANYDQGTSTSVKLKGPKIAKVTFDATFNNAKNTRCDLSTNGLFQYCLVLDKIALTSSPAATFSSNPPPGSTINLGSAPVGTPLSSNLSIVNSGNARLTISAADGLVAPFSISPVSAFNLDSGQGGGIALKCTPAALTNYTTTLTYNTNDPLQAKVSYTVKCSGTPPPEASSFNVLAPARLYDSRSNAPSSIPQGREGKFALNEVRVIQATGTQPGQVPSGASAILANVTVTEASGGGYVTVFPADQNDSATATVNWYNGGARIVGSFTLIALDSQGRFKIKAGGETQVIVDVVGYMSKNSAASMVTASGVYKPLPVGINPRLYDSREIGISSGLLGAGTGPLLKSSPTRTIPIAGANSVQKIPASATAVVVNLTAVATVGGGYLTFFPAATPTPQVATVNWNDWRTPGTNIPRDVGNLAIVPLSATGELTMIAGGNSASAGANVVIDVLGYIDQPTSGVAGFYYPLATPTRLYDSRSTEPNYASNSSKGTLAPKATRTIKTAGIGIPATAKSILVRVTAIDSSGGGYLALYPGDVFTGAVTVNLNGVNQQIGNLAIVDLDKDGNFTVLNGSQFNSIGFVIDLVGYL